MRPGRASVLIVALLAAAGCNDTPTAPTESAETGPITTPRTVTYPGIVGAGGSVSRSFDAQIPGAARAVLSGISPATALAVGMGVPRADGSGCLLGLSSVATTGESAEVGTTVAAGTFCVQVYAPAQSADAVRFTVTLTHP